MDTIGYQAQSAGQLRDHTLSTRHRRGFLALLLVAALALLTMSATTPARAVSVPAADAHASVPVGLSAYEWRRVDTTPLAELAAGFEGFRAIGGTEISLDISYVVNIAAMKNANARARAQELFDVRAREYVAAAHAAGLAVEALAGDPVWIKPAKRPAVSVVVNYVAAFNAANPALSFTGLHFDLEPWTRPNWATAAGNLTRNWLDTVAELTAQQAATPAATRTPLTFVVPFWLDGLAAPVTLNYAGVKASPTGHIVRMLDNGAGQVNAISVMAYREIVGGPNGSAALSENEMALADATNGRVQAIIAQEVSDVEPAFITFWQEGRTAMVAAMNDLHTTFGARTAFGGFAVNDFRSLVVMPQGG